MPTLSLKHARLVLRGILAAWLGIGAYELVAGADLALVPLAVLVGITIWRLRVLSRQ